MKYKVVYEVSKSAIVEAENKEEAIRLVNEGEVDAQEDEITAEAEAFENN